MKRIVLIIISILLLTLIFIKSPTLFFENSTLKIDKKDPFKNSIVTSQFFNIKTEQDTVVEAKYGTKVVFQKQCFIDSKGNVITGEVKFELAEALTLDKMVFSNLTTTSNNQILETGGMIFINAYHKNKEVFINKNKPYKKT